MASLETSGAEASQEETEDESWPNFEQGSLFEIRGIDSKGKQRCWQRLVQHEWTFESVSELVRKKTGATKEQKIEISCSKTQGGSGERDISMEDVNEQNPSNPRFQHSSPAVAHTVRFTLLSISSSPSRTNDAAVEKSASPHDEAGAEEMLEVLNKDQSDLGGEKEQERINSSSSSEASRPPPSSSSLPPAASIKRKFQPKYRPPVPIPRPNPLLAPTPPNAPSSSAKHTISTTISSLHQHPWPTSLPDPPSFFTTAFQTAAQLRHKRTRPSHFGSTTSSSQQPALPIHPSPSEPRTSSFPRTASLTVSQRSWTPYGPSNIPFVSKDPSPASSDHGRPTTLKASPSPFRPSPNLSTTISSSSNFDQPLVSSSSGADRVVRKEELDVEEEHRRKRRRGEDDRGRSRPSVEDDGEALEHLRTGIDLKRVGSRSEERRRDPRQSRRRRRLVNGHYGGRP
ncbi:hypothetical protein BDY24DRAFT_372594 [Mrakia frigida]|uniref:uncharacterized protein n=1 Tax=Mrakia frigida TaxID=29902 RepID=UPI003FCBF092